MKLHSFKKGLHIAVMALMVFYFSGFMPLITIPTAEAARLPQSATVNGGASTTVASGATVSVTFHVITNGSSSANDWESTSWKIGTNPGGSFACKNTGDHTTGGNYTETFSVIAPTNPGTYNLYLKAHDGDVCTNAGESGLFTLSNAIVVENPTGTIKVYKNIDTDGDGTFEKDSNWANSHGFDWQLDGGTNQDFNQSVETSTGGHFVSESMPDTYQITGWYEGGGDCNIAATYDGTSLPAQVLVTKDHRTTVTLCDSIINQPKLTVTKVVVGGSKSVSDFPLFVNETSVISGEQNTFDTGTYTVSETSDPDYSTSFSGDCDSQGSVNLNTGDIKSCTITNTFNPKPAVIDAYKIICPTETVLPDWGRTNASKPSSITQWFDSGDAATWVEENGCEFSNNWNFEWAYDPAGNPEDGDNDYNNTDPDWHSFSVTTPLELTDLGNGKIWVREQVDPAYIPFNGTTSTTEKKVSAEMYCHDDILNYDNYDWIGQKDALVYGKTYKCVAFNVLAFQPAQAKVCKEIDADGILDTSDDREAYSGWGMHLQKNTEGWETVATQLTGKDGCTTFTITEPGSYRVMENQPDGYITLNSDGYFWLGEVESGEQNYQNTFVNTLEHYSLHGYKWHDVNANGIRDCVQQPENDFQTVSLDRQLIQPSRLCEEYSEELLPDWTIFIDENGNQQLDEGEMSTTTSSEEEHYGWYWFEGLTTGTYSVCEQIPEGWQQIYPDFTYQTQCHTVTLPYRGETDTCVFDQLPNAVTTDQSCNFGNRMTPALDIQKSVLVNGEVSETANEGDTLSYTITVTNNGDEAAKFLYVEDTTPTNTTLVEHSGDLDEATFSGDTFRWGPFDLAGGESTTFTFDVTVNAGLPVGDTLIENQASLWQESPDVESVEVGFFHKLFGIHTASAAEPILLLIASSNTVLTTITIAEEPKTPETPETPGKVLGDTTAPKLTITKTSNVEFTNPNGTVNYTITIKNTGDGQALNVVLKDTLPAGFTFDDNSTSKTWNLGSVDVDGSKTVSYTATVGQDLEAGQYINTAVVSASNHDDVTATNEVEVRVPKVLGDSAPDTGTTPRDYAIFISSLLLIASGIFLIRRGQATDIA